MKVSGVSYKVLSTNAVEYVSPNGKKSKLTKVTIPKTVVIEGKTYTITSIATKAFYKYKKLKKITIKADKLGIIGKNSFGKIAKKAVIKVPKKQYKKYKKLLLASKFKGTIKK